MTGALVPPQPSIPDVPSADPPHDVTKHMLGPHVVGQRVVVRRVLRGQTGPSGGPALTDLLGTCLSWAGGSCVIQPETGPAVTIALADIVSGKPVPPRPSPRHRVAPPEAQRRALALFPDLVTEPLGGWTLRHSPTSTARRANSVLAMAPCGADGALERVVDFYATRTGRPIAAVLPDSPEDALFRSHGWVLESEDADTLFQIAPVSQASRVVSRLGRQSAVAPRPPVSYDEHGDLVTVRLGDLASGVAAYGDDWVGFRGIEVSPERRRRGL